MTDGKPQPTIIWIAPMWWMSRSHWIEWATFFKPARVGIQKTHFGLSVTLNKSHGQKKTRQNKKQMPQLWTFVQPIRLRSYWIFLYQWFLWGSGTMSGHLQHHGSASIFLNLWGHLAEPMCLDVYCQLEMLSQLIQFDYHSQALQLPLGVSEGFHDDFSAETLERGAGKIWVNFVLRI